MPIYLYWGDDDFSLLQAVERLRSAVVDPSWDSFNSDRIVSDQANSIVMGLNQAMTPPFGLGGRFVWLADTPDAAMFNGSLSGVRTNPARDPRYYHLTINQCQQT